MQGISESLYALLTSVGNLPLSRAWAHFLRDDYFVVFWLLTLVAFVVRQSWLRCLYVLFFFGSMFGIGLLGMSLVAWPFHHWHLWARMLPEKFTFYEVGVEDVSGNVFLYDCLAARPLVPAILRRRFAAQMLDASHGEVMAQWLLERANTYHPQSDPLSWIEFPQRTPGARWPLEHKEFVALVVRSTRVELGQTLGDSVFTVVKEKKFR